MGIGMHCVTVGFQGVDFAIMAKKPERLSKSPIGICIGAVSAVENRKPSLKGRVEKVLKIFNKLVTGQQAFIVDQPGGNATYVGFISSDMEGMPKNQAPPVQFAFGGLDVGIE